MFALPAPSLDSFSSAHMSKHFISCSVDPSDVDTERILQRICVPDQLADQLHCLSYRRHVLLYYTLNNTQVLPCVQRGARKHVHCLVAIVSWEHVPFRMLMYTSANVGCTSPIADFGSNGIPARLRFC